MRRRGRRAALKVLHRFRVRLERYKLVSPRAVREELLRDPIVRAAIRDHAATHGTSALDAKIRVESYVDEMVPYFNVLGYYRLGFNLARVLVNLLFRVRARYVAPEALRSIPPGDVVVYLMNHRSNADYIVVAYVLAREVSISYAVGEWARVWPLEYVFKAFGAYFVRRRFREPLYHTVLERYVQLITRRGVTQGIFLEGGLTRDGVLRPAKLGLLDYVARTLADPDFHRDVWLVPVALNYDRVLEDRSLILELLEPQHRPGRARQLMGVLRYLTINLWRLVTGRLRRYGRAAVEFGAPLSLRAWLAEHAGVLQLPRSDRLAQLQGLADSVLQRIASIMPVTPVPLTAAALLSFGESLVPRRQLVARLDGFRAHLIQTGARLVQPEDRGETILERAWATLRMRRLVVREGAAYVVLPRQRPLLEFYANSVRHLLPGEPARISMHPAHDPDRTLPRLRHGAHRPQGR